MPRRRELLTPNLNDIMIVGNYISGNAADNADAATTGTAGINIFSLTPVYGTVIAENTIDNQAIDVVMNAPGSMEVHLNNLLGGKAGVANTGAGVINASMNFWGCPGGPGTAGCAAVTGPASGSSVWLSTPAGSAPSAPRQR
jgi:hypothetical protein